VLLLGVLLACPALPCLAGDSYLDRSKVREATPYGTTVEPPTSHEPTKATGEPDGGRPSRTTPPKSETSTTVQPGSTQGGERGGPADESR
jgi:hypothetical protein